MMNNLKQLFFAAALVIGISITASAQKEGDKNPPPKPKPPIIVVNPDKNPDKKPKEDKPKGDKKPEAFIFGFRNETIFE